MKILSVSDLHARPQWWRWLYDQAPSYDVVCLAGDLLDMFETSEGGLRRQADHALVELANLPAAHCVCVTGNHDVWEDPSPEYHEGAWLQRARRPGLAVDGDVLMIGLVKFVAGGWLVPPPASRNRRTTVVTHAPPAGLAVAEEFGEDIGDVETRHLVESLAPGSIVLSGHVHTPRRWNSTTENLTTCFNAGCDLRAPVPNHITINLGRREATLHTQGRSKPQISF